MGHFMSKVIGEGQLAVTVHRNHSCLRPDARASSLGRVYISRNAVTDDIPTGSSIAKCG